MGTNRLSDPSRVRTCVIWGYGNDYESIINQIRFEILKGNMQIQAIVARDRITASYDGFRVVGKEQLNQISFEYIIVTSSRYRDEIRKEIIEMGYREEQIIKGDVFRLPCFDFDRYASLIENPVTIISNDCWGGHLYHYLGLKMTSPTVNCFILANSYNIFVNHLDEYLSHPLELYQEGSLENQQYPIGIIHGCEGDVLIHFNHASVFAEAEYHWNRRKKRVNKNNIFVKWGESGSETGNIEIIKKFDKITYPKIGFFSGETNDLDRVASMKRFLKQNSWEYRKERRKGQSLFEYKYANWTHDMYNNTAKMIDVFKLLTGEESYLREI